MRLRFAAGSALALAAAPVAAQTPAQTPEQPSKWEVATGVDYSAGRYGASVDTTVFDVRTDAKLQLDRWRLEAALPFVVLHGPGELVDGVPVSTGSATTSTRSGLGDLGLSTGYLVSRGQGRLPALELAASVKIPTAKLGIGTGAADYGIAANLYQSVTPTIILFGSAGYSWLGSSSLYTLKDGVAASAGIDVRPKPGQEFGFSLAWRGSVATGIGPQVTVSPYYIHRVSKDWGLTLYALAGLTDASPRLGAGVWISLFR